MSKRAKYRGVEEGESNNELVFMFLDEFGNKIELLLAKEEAEELWDDLEVLVHIDD